MNRAFRYWVAGVVAAMVGGVAAVRADQVTLTASLDNTMYEAASGGVSNGIGSYVFIGRNEGGTIRRALLKFDLSAIPPGSVITDAQIKMNMSRTTGGAATSTVHRLFADWGEGNSDASGNEGGGAVADASDATWTCRLHPLFFWTNPGGDFAATASSTLLINGIGAYTWTGSALAADCQGWVDNPNTNHGWIIRGDESDIHTTKRFDSRQSGTAGNRPRLIVTFTPGAALGACCLQGGASCQVLSPTACASQGGVYLGTGVPCSPGSCTVGIGACCVPNGTCTVGTALQCTAQGGTYQGDNTTCTNGLCPVLTLTPFVDPLPRPPTAQPVSGQPGGAAVYAMSAQRVTAKLHRDLPNTTLYAYNGSVPGPTIEASANQPVTVTWRNDLRGPTGELLQHHDLPVDTCVHGPDQGGDLPRLVTHFHGGRVDALSDGPPDATQAPGEVSPPYLYPNNQSAATLWYHDHAVGMTRLNVYMGLAGMYILRDAQEQALNLPSGEYEWPLIISDRSFAADGSMRYVHPAGGDADHAFGDTFLVNGKVWPFLNVKLGKYRFRVLNACNSRVLTLALDSGVNMKVIGTDAGLLAAPVSRPTLTLAPGERADIIIDFGIYAEGFDIIMTNSAPAPYPGTPGVGVIPQVIKFHVMNQPGNTNPLPTTLRTITPIPESSATQHRTFLLERIAHPCMGFMWTINGLSWDDITEFPRYGDAEVWQFANNSGVVHPMHIHLVQFMVLDRQDFTVVNGQIVTSGSRVPPDAAEAGWKDTVQATPRQITRVIARFDGFGGTFPYHCHILEHEDHEMMRQFTIRCWNDITGQPRDHSANLGTTTQFFLDATGAGTLHYEWRHDGVTLVNGPTGRGSVISGATTGVLTITNVRPGDAGLYDGTVRDDCGPLNSRLARLTVVPACDADLNQDGNADQDDVAYLIGVVAGGPNPFNVDPDFNHDGNADQDDIAALVNVIAGGPCP